MIHEFEYKKDPTSEEVSKRKVIVFHEDDLNESGIDLNLLPEDLAKEAEELYKDNKPTPFPAKGEKTDKTKLNENWKPEFGKAWRNFSKAKIVKTTSISVHTKVWMPE